MEIPALLQPSSLSEIPTVKDPDVAAAWKIFLKIFLADNLSSRLKIWESCRVLIGALRGDQRKQIMSVCFQWLKIKHDKKLKMRMVNVPASSRLAGSKEEISILDKSWMIPG